MLDLIALSSGSGSGTGGTLTSLLEDLAPVVEAVLGYAVEIGNTVVETPLLLMTTGILLLGGAIGIFGRLLSRG